MKGLGKLAVIIGIVIAIAAVVTRVLGMPRIDLGLIQILPVSVLTGANTAIIIGVALMLWGE